MKSEQRKKLGDAIENLVDRMRQKSAICTIEARRHLDKVLAETFPDDKEKPRSGRLADRSDLFRVKWNNFAGKTEPASPLWADIKKDRAARKLAKSGLEIEDGLSLRMSGQFPDLLELHFPSHKSLLQFVKQWQQSKRRRARPKKHGAGRRALSGVGHGRGSPSPHRV